MIFQKNKTIELFDKFLLTIPTKLKHHQDEIHGEKIQLNGQMTAKPGYKWSDNIEPTLITILQGIRIKS